MSADAAGIIPDNIYSNTTNTIMKFKHLSAAALAIASLAGVCPAGVQAAEETWKSIGTGMLRDDCITNFYFLSNYYEFPVEMQESEQTPGRYRLVNAYINCPPVGGDAFPAITNYLVVDASDPVHVYIEPGCVNYYMGEDQAMCLWSMADDYYKLHDNWDLADEEGVCGTLADGVITFPRGAVLATPIDEISFDPTIHDNMLWYQTNKNGMFRIKLPGTPNTDIDITYVGLNDAQTGVQYDIRLGDGVENAKIGVFEGEYTSDMRTQIEQGTVQTYDFATSGIFNAPYEHDGTFTVVIVPYANGHSWAPSYVTRQWSFSEAEWKKVGKGTYTESIMSSNELKNYGFQFSEYTYSVDVEQSVAEPWVIRLVDPYGPESYPVATSINYDIDHHYYMYFDLGTFDCVHLRLMEHTGLNLGLGRMAIRSNSDYYMNENPFGTNMTLAEYMADSSKPKGHYDAASKTVTYDKDGLRLMFSEARPGAWYYANENGNAKLVLPSDIVVTPNPNAASVADLETEDNAVAEYFTADGVKVDGRNLAAGVYIVRKGNKVSKILVK